MCKQIIITNPWQTLDDAVINHFKQIVCADNNADGFGIATNGGYLKYAKPAAKVNSVLQAVHSLDFVHGGEGTLPAKAANVLMAHGRYSTNDIGIKETHPIVDSGIQLVHNGVVRTDTAYETVTRNDSELILRAYQAGGIAEVLENMGGYYAFGLMDTTQDALYIVRDNTALLYVSRVEQTNSLIFSTKADDIHAMMKGAAGKLNKKALKYDMPVLMKDCTVVEFELSTGRLLDTYTFTKKAATYPTYKSYDYSAEGQADKDYMSDTPDTADYDMNNVLNYTQRKTKWGT
jgi:asparagine synthetase B (glutamine-hydrolysing)